MLRDLRSPTLSSTLRPNHVTLALRSPGLHVGDSYPAVSSSQNAVDVSTASQLFSHTLTAPFFRGRTSRPTEKPQELDSDLRNARREFLVGSRHHACWVAPPCSRVSGRQPVRFSNPRFELRMRCAAPQHLTFPVQLVSRRGLGTSPASEEAGQDARSPPSLQFSGFLQAPAAPLWGRGVGGLPCCPVSLGRLSSVSRRGG